MAYVRFKPVCNCGYIFENFTYIAPHLEQGIDAAQQVIRIIRYDDCFLPRHCPNCGERITNFSTPVFTCDGGIVYKEEE